MPPPVHRNGALLTIAGTASLLMGAFHFLLPHIFGWNRFVTDVPAPVRWGLFAINVFFSTLLVLGGAGSIILAFHRREYDVVAWSLLLTMTVFWLVNASYQILYPFPVARLRWILLGFGIAVFLLYAITVFRAMRTCADRSGA